jgi:hypothetical protein
MLRTAAWCALALGVCAFTLSSSLALAVTARAAPGRATATQECPAPEQPQVLEAPVVAPPAPASRAVALPITGNAGLLGMQAARSAGLQECVTRTALPAADTPVPAAATATPAPAATPAGAAPVIPLPGGGGNGGGLDVPGGTQLY